MKQILIAIPFIFLSVACSPLDKEEVQKTPEEVTLEMSSQQVENVACDRQWCQEWGYCCNSHNTACTQCQAQVQAEPLLKLEESDHAGEPSSSPSTN